MAQDSIGRNQVFPIYNADETPFHGLVIRKSSVESAIMSLGDKISGDVYYADNSLAFTMQEYIVYNGVKYVLVSPPTVVREGKVSDNGELKGMTKYSLTFYHPMYMLGNFPFTDVAVTQEESKYLSQSKTFAWIGNLFDFIAKLNANLAGTDWIVAANIVHYEQDGTTVTSEWKKAEKISDVLSFDKQFVADALKTAFDTWEIPFTIVKTNITGKKFLVEFGLPSQEIYGQDGVTPFIFQFGQGVGLSNNSRTPKNNKIITRLAGEGTERNIPYGYPQIIWTGNQDWDYTINNASGMQSITVGGETIQAMSYPIYDGIVGGQKVRLIKHPFTRKTLMPSIYAETVNLKVNPNATGYDPDTVIVDYYDATVEEDYPNPINLSAPSFENHQFEDIYPRLGDDVALVGVYPYDERTFISISEFNTFVGSKIDQSDIEYEKGILRALIQTIAEATSSFNSSHADANYSYSVNAKATVYEYGIWFDVDYTSDDANFRCNVYRGTYSPRDSVDWDDTMDDDGNYEQKYFKIRLPQLSFDVYASASITESMEINMRSGACLGCTFQIQVDWDDYKRNFFDANGNFDPVIGTGHPRDGEKYPDSSQGQIDVVVQKDINTFGTLMPNEYQQPASGDKFVILGISLPLTYITAAEEELDDAMKAYMLENNVHYYDYPLKFDEYFLATHTEILSQIKNNSIVRFKYAGTDVALYVKQITVKYNDGVLPKYDIVLTDDIEVVLSKIGQVVDDVDKLSYIVSAMRQSSSTNELKDLKDINTKLSRVQEDTAKGKITFADGVKFGTNQSAHGIKKNGDADLHHVATDGNVTIGNYNRGTPPHTGAKITSDGNGDFVGVTTENLAVTKEAHFFKLVVDELLSNKGAIIISSANCVAESVNEDHSTYTILFSKTDKNGVEVNNPWKVGDHALCLTFRGEGAGTFSDVKNRYYWRKVVSIYTGDTYHSISLSKTDGEGSTVPAVGDNIVQLGYSGQEEMPSRQTAIILSAYQTMDTGDSNANIRGLVPPSFAFYKGINDFALSSHRYTYMDGVANEFFGDFKVLVNNSYTSMTTLLATTNRLIAEIRNDLGTVGVDINGDDMAINLKAGKVNFLMPDDSTNAKISIDPTTGTLHAVDGEFEGTVRATNLFHSVCYFTEGNTIDNGEYYSNENSNVLYYYNEDLVSETPPTGFVDGHYYTEEEIGEYKGDACFIPTTGKADVAMCMPRVGYNWEPDNYGRLPYIRLPKPEDFQGKVVEVSGFCYAENNSGTFVKTFGVRCVCSDFDPNDRRMSGLVYSDPNGYPSAPIRTVIPYTETVISTGGTARFMSVELSDGSWVWVLLANQTGGDVYIGDGSISGGTVTSVGLVMPSGTFNVSNTPITSKGNLTVSFANQNANLVFASPNGSDGAPSWRSLVVDDIPSLAASKITSGMFDAARIPNLSWNKITSNKPTTLAGYGITDAKIDGGVITLGDNSITPLTQHQSLSNYVQKSQTAGLLKNDGTVDTNTYLTSIPSNYVSVDNNGMLSHQIQTNDQLFIYGTGNNFGELIISDAALYDAYSLSANANGKMTWDGDAVATESWVSGQGFSRGHSVYGGLTSGYQVVDDGDFIRWDMPFTFDPDDGGTVIPAFLPLSDVGVLNGKVLRLAELPRYDVIKANSNYNQDYNRIDGNIDPDDYSDEAYFKGLVRWAITEYLGVYKSNGSNITLIGSARPNSTGTVHIDLYGGSGRNPNADDPTLPMYCSGMYLTLSGTIFIFGTIEGAWYWRQINSASIDAASLGGVAAANYATQSWVNSQGHVASAGALKYGGNTKAEAGLNGVTVTGQLVTTNSVVAQGGIVAIGYVDIDDDLNFVRIQSIYDSQTQERYVEFVGYGENDGTKAPTAYKFDSEVRATAFKKTGSSNDYVLLGGGGTKAVTDFATWMDSPVTARGLNVAGDSTLAAPHVRMTYDYVSAGRFSMNFKGYAGDSLAAPISYIFDAPVTQSSDIRMKDIIRDKDYDAECIAKMPLVTFSWKKDEEKREHFGTIAQNWEEVIPEVVIEGGDGMKSMDYGAAAMAAGVTACREVVALKKEIEELKKIIRELKNNK